MRVFLSTGEVSGDIVGAHLASAILARDFRAELIGVGGARMAAAGVTIDVPTNHLGTVGVTEALSAIPSLGRVLLAIRRRVKVDRPDVAVLIGNDVFNVLLARWLRRQGIPTLSYFPPQVWIWRAVAPFIARSFDGILTSFPEEQAVYARVAPRSGAAVSFVGHYLAETVSPRTPADTLASRHALGLPATGTVVALLPGSRVQEVRSLARLLLGAAEHLARRDPAVRFVLPVAEVMFTEQILREVGRSGLGDRVLVCDDSRAAMRACDVTVLASGTASLEAALLGVPTVIVYTVSGVTVAVVRAAIRCGLMDSETVGLPNLILGRAVVPELRQRQATPEAVALETSALLLDRKRRDAMVEELGRVRAAVWAPGTLDRVATAALALARERRALLGADTSCREAGLGDALRGRG